MIKEANYKVGELDMYYKYYDKNGEEIKSGDYISINGHTPRKVYSTEDGQLGTDSTNPQWILDGRAYPGQYGLYVLTEGETNDCVLVKDYEEPQPKHYRELYETTITFVLKGNKEKNLLKKTITDLINSTDCIEYNCEEKEI